MSKKKKPFTDADSGILLQAQRARSGKTQQQLADAIGITAQAVAKYERGKSSMTVARAVQVARALGTSPRLLVPED